MRRPRHAVLSYALGVRSVRTRQRALQSRQPPARGSGGRSCSCRGRHADQSKSFSPRRRVLLLILLRGRAGRSQWEAHTHDAARPAHRHATTNTAARGPHLTPLCGDPSRAPRRRRLISPPPSWAALLCSAVAKSLPPLPPRCKCSQRGGGYRATPAEAARRAQWRHRPRRALRGRHCARQGPRRRRCD